MEECREYDYHKGNISVVIGNAVNHAMGAIVTLSRGSVNNVSIISESRWHVELITGYFPFCKLLQYNNIIVSFLKSKYP